MTTVAKATRLNMMTCSWPSRCAAASQTRAEHDREYHSGDGATVSGGARRIGPSPSAKTPDVARDKGEYRRRKRGHQRLDSRIASRQGRLARSMPRRRRLPVMTPATRPNPYSSGATGSPSSWSRRVTAPRRRCTPRARPRVPVGVRIEVSFGRRPQPAPRPAGRAHPPRAGSRRRRRARAATAQRHCESCSRAPPLVAERSATKIGHTDGQVPLLIDRRRRAAEMSRKIRWPVDKSIGNEPNHPANAW